MFRDFSEFFRGINSALEFSDEYNAFIVSGYKCSSCGKKLVTRFGKFTFNIYSNDGTKISRIPALSPPNEILECPHCNHRWMTSKKNLNIANRLDVTNIIETHVSEELERVTEEFFENAGENADNVEHTIANTQEHLKTYIIEYEKTHVNGTDFSLKLKVPEVELGEIKISSQEELKKKYSVSEETKTVYAIGTKFSVAKFKRVTVISHWKCFYQNGYVELRSQNNTIVTVPFKVLKKENFERRLF